MEIKPKEVQETPPVIGSLKTASLFKITLIFLILAIGLKPLIAYAPNNYVTIYPNAFFQGTSGGGLIDFYEEVRTNGWVWSNGLIVFQNLRFVGGYTWGELGFASTETLEVYRLTSTRVAIRVTADNLDTSVTRVYVGSARSPTTIDNADHWTYDRLNRIVTIRKFHSSTETITLIWEVLPTPQTIPISTLLYQYLGVGDVSGFIIALYTFSLGEMFFGFIALALTIPVYIRTKSLGYVSIMWILLGTILNAMIPGQGITIGRILIVIGVTTISYKAYMGRRD